MELEKTEKIKIFALGGVGEIGKNMYVVEVDSDIFVIDAGLMFPDEEMLGIDIVIPDTTYLQDNRDRVKGLFVTHGHEDHIGGISYLVKKLDIPVYGTKLTLGLVEGKLRDAGVLAKTTLHIIDSNTILDFGKARISFFRTSHSIPDSVGVSVHTSQGAIVHTGDFKFDQTPVDKYGAEMHKMAALGQDGVLCLLSDSTNAEKPGYSSSERMVGEEIRNVLRRAGGRVILASFASNVHRIQQVIDATSESGRKLVVVGRSMVRVIDIASTLGYLIIPQNLVISVSDIDKHDENKITILTTGSQGEPLAALSRMAKGMHKQVTVKKGDTVIISATPIPGNELSVSQTINLLFRSGADVIYGDKKIHVSGHGYQEELKLMLQLMKPKFFIPIHGEYRMQKAHTRLAEAVGVESNNIFLLEKGDTVEIVDGNAKRGMKVHTGNILIDGLGVGDIGNIVLRDRKLLSRNGILIVVITLSRGKKCIVSGPEIISRGFVYVRESEVLINNASKLVRELVEKSIRENNMEWGSLKANIRDGLNQYLYEQTRRKPMILPIIMEV